MAQRPTADFNIDPNVTSGTDLANILNRFQDAIDSGNSGSSRPPYLDAGGLWVREGDPMRLYLYDGTTDRELYNTTDGLVDASQWEDNGKDIYFNKGSVGILTDSPETTLDVNGTFRYGSAAINAPDANAATRPGFYGTADVSLVTNYPSHFNNGYASLVTIAGNNQNNLTQLAFSQNSFSPSYRNVRSGNILNWCQFVVTDANGNVGIGMTPLLSTAKEQLAEWKSRFEAILEDDPKADKKAVTLEITDDAFEVLPSEGELAEWMETRAAGDRLQVDGNISASGEVSANTIETNRPANGLFFEAKQGDNSTTFNHSGSDTLEISPLGSKMKVNGAVDADGFTVNGGPLTRVSDLIETLSTLRNATKDETTIEGLRDAIGDAVGGLIQKFEAIE